MSNTPAAGVQRPPGLIAGAQRRPPALPLKGRFSGAGILLLFALGGCATAPRTLPPQDSTYPLMVENAVRERAVAGDWLVIRGRHRTDDLVATLTNMPLSHAAVWDPERQQVIEAEGIGVHATPITDFIGKSERLLVIHPQ